MKPVNRDLLSLNRLIHIRAIDGYELRTANVLLCELSMELSTLRQRSVGHHMVHIWSDRMAQVVPYSYCRSL